MLAEETDVYVIVRVRSNGSWTHVHARSSCAKNEESRRRRRRNWRGETEGEKSRTDKWKEEKENGKWDQ